MFSTFFITGHQDIWHWKKCHSVPLSSLAVRVAGDSSGGGGLQGWSLENCRRVHPLSSGASSLTFIVLARGYLLLPFYEDNCSTCLDAPFVYLKMTWQQTPRTSAHCKGIWFLIVRGFYLLIRRGNTFFFKVKIYKILSSWRIPFVLIIFSVMSLGNLPSLIETTLADREMVLKLFFRFTRYWSLSVF